MTADQAKNLATSLSLFNWSDALIDDGEGYRIIGKISRQDVAKLHGLPNPSLLAEVLTIALERIGALEAQNAELRRQADTLRRVHELVTSENRKERGYTPVYGVLNSNTTQPSSEDDRV